MPVEHIPEWQQKLAKKWEKKYNTDRTLDCHDDPVEIWNSDGSNRIRFATQAKALEFCILSAIRAAIQENATGLYAENKRLRERVEELEKALQNIKSRCSGDSYHIASYALDQYYQNTPAVETPAVADTEPGSDPQSGEGGKKK